MPSPAPKFPPPGALVEAVINYDLAAVKRLLQQGANPSDTDGYGNSALGRAASYAYVEIARVLIEAGAKLDMRNRLGETPLIIAVSTGYSAGRETIVRMLLDKGAKMDIKNNNGETAMDIAVSKSFTQIIKMMNEAAANRKRLADEFARATTAKKQAEIAEKQKRLKELARDVPKRPKPPKAA